MIYVTNDAKQELRRLLTTCENMSGDYLRIIDKGQGVLGLVNDKMKPEDQKVDYEGKVLVVTEPGLTSGHRNVSLDAYRTSEGTRLVISEEDINLSSKTVTVNWIPLPQS